MPQKNLRLLSGKPLIAYTIEAARTSSLLDRTVVSTDDPQIAEVAQQWGADVPFLRPLELATDESPVYPALNHALCWLEEKERYRPDWAMLLQPTSPLRTAEDIDNAITIAKEKDADGVVSLCEPKHHPYWVKGLAEDGHIVDFLSLDHPYHRRQELPAAYAVNGAIYLARREILLEQESFYTDRTYPYLMPPERSLDIDSAWDLYVAGLILGAKESRAGV